MIKLHRLKKSHFQIIFILLLTFGIIKLSDFFVGKVIKKNPVQPFFRANTEAIYSLPEYTIKVKLNSKGFRGKEFSEIKKENIIRILIIGDSFSFGWSVNLEDSWPYLLERELNKIKNKKFEIFNLSVPGNTPGDYSELAKKYISLYKPDYVIVGIVEGNDFTQTILNTEKSNALITDYAIKKRDFYTRQIDKIPFYQDFNNIIKTSFPNIYFYMAQAKVTDVRQNFKTQMKEIINKFDDDDFRVMENNSSPEIINIFLDGGINPPLFFWSIRVPDFYAKVLNENGSEYADAKNKLNRIIKEINNLILINNSKMIILDIPNGVYVSNFHLKNYRDMGFETRDDMLISELPNKIIQEISKSEKIELIDSLDYFRNKCTDKCFWRYDDHLTAYGNKVLAEKVNEYFKKEFSN